LLHETDNMWLPLWRNYGIHRWFSQIPCGWKSSQPAISEAFLRIPLPCLPILK
jgi:hypothetical protein